MVFSVHDTVIEDNLWVDFVRRDSKNDLFPFRKYYKIEWITSWCICIPPMRGW